MRRRVALRLRGTVQGVGLRPWAAREARARGLAGSVRNAPDGVRCELEGEAEAVAGWLAALRERPPAGAQLEGIDAEERPLRGEAGFALLPSETASAERPTCIPPDVPVCPACLEELFDPAARRHRYPFTHCAGCGPRASVLRALPFDRARTSLADFPPCAECLREYDDAEDRRFHAQTIACPACGPRLQAREADGSRADGDPVELAAARLRAGGIVALLGYGGFHVAADARSAEALARLRKRKGRPAKPFALLLPDLAAARALLRLAAEDEALLAGPARALLIAPRREAACAALGLAEEVAPGARDLGVLLPCAPLQHLLLFGPGARPGRDAARFPALVMTSGNLSGEPTEHEPAEALARLAGVADLFLLHDRAVTQPCDDPVFRSAPGGPIPLRLSRGSAPRRFPLPARLAATPPLLALGGDLKCAPAVLAHGEIHLGAHLGDLEALRAADALELRARELARLLGVAPQLVVHDRHPGYFGTALAPRLAPRTLAVQHHHAHAAAGLLEHGMEGPALALALDGSGDGGDGTLWGGELLRVTLAECARVAHLEAVPLPGGERAVREPWRMAAVWLARAFPDGDAPASAWQARHPAAARARILALAARGPNAPLTSSCGRLFDAAASLLGCGDAVSFEGEAALALEALAASAPEEEPEDAPGFAGGARLDAAALIRALVLDRARGTPPARAARRFHERLAALLAAAACHAGRRLGLDRVVLTGGCFQNRLLLESLCARLAAAGMTPLRPRRAPPNDAGLALGQAAVAAAWLARGAGARE